MTTKRKESSRVGVLRFAARAVLTGACGAALWCAAKALASPDLEWRVMALAVLAFALGPTAIEVRGRHGGRVSLPPVHAVLFAGSLALGPYGTALPAIFAGASRLVSGSRDRRPISLFLVTLLRPAAVCCASAAAYELLGGSEALPQQVSSVTPVLLAGCVYALTAAALTGLSRRSSERGTPPPEASTVAAAWCSCLAAGYVLAVLYASAPAYVLLAPAAAAALARMALRERVTHPAETESGSRADAAAPSEGEALFVDHTTGLATRRYLEMFLESEIGRAQRFRKNVSLAVFDIDGSARLLEESGQEALDSLVAQLGDRLKEGLREYDVVARYAPGRVAVVLPESSLEQALEVAERLHASLELRHEDGKPVSVSAGIASFPEHASTPEELIHSSHRALNRGRFEGPSRVCASQRLDRAS